MYNIDIYSQNLSIRKTCAAVVLFYLTSNNSTNIFNWNILFIFILMVCNFSIGDQFLPHPHAMQFMSTTEMTYTPRGPPDSPTMTCGSSTQARLSAVCCVLQAGSSQPKHSTAGVQPRLRSPPPSALQTILSWNQCFLPSPRYSFTTVSSLIYFFCRIFLDPCFSMCTTEMLSKILPFLDNRHPFMTLTILILYTFCILQKTKQYPLWRTSMQPTDLSPSLALPMPEFTI